MRADLRRAVTLVVAAATLTLAGVSAGSTPVSAEPLCQPGTNWDGVLKVCR